MHLISLGMLSETAPPFPFILLALFWPENNTAATECSYFSTLCYSSSQNLALESSMFSLSITTSRSPRTYLCFSPVCFLCHYLCSQMISAIRTVIGLLCFSLQAALSKYESRAIWIPENECCSFLLVMYITWGLETAKINIGLLLSVLCPCKTVNLDTINLNYCRF